MLNVRIYGEEGSTSAFSRFQKGDIFFIHNDLGDGWLWVTAHRTGEQGLVFRDLLAGLDDSIDPNAVFPWFHRRLSKNEAVELLVRGGPGSFLVRPSDNSPGDYSLFFHINNQIQRFRIEKKGVRYVMGGRNFDCLEAVINRYKTEQIVEGHTLGHYIKRVSRVRTYVGPNSLDFERRIAVDAYTKSYLHCTTTRLDSRSPRRRLNRDSS